MQARDYHHPAYPINEVSDAIPESPPHGPFVGITLIPKSVLEFSETDLETNIWVQVVDPGINPREWESGKNERGKKM